MLDLHSKKSSLVGKNMSIYHEFVDRIDKSVPRVTVWHHKALSDVSDPSEDLSILSSSVGFFILQVLGCQRLNKFSVTIKYSAFMLAILRKHVISDFVLSLNDKVI